MAGLPGRYREKSVVPLSEGTTTSPSMIAEHALMCHASSAIFRKRLVQSLPRREKTLIIHEVVLHPVTVELDFVKPTIAGRDLLDGYRERGFNEAGERCLGADGGRLLTLERHGYTKRVGQLNVVVLALVTIGEILKKEGNIAHLQIAASAQFLSNLYRNFLRPAFGGVESNYPDRIAVLACKRS
jgi:hypothetical protein